MSSSECWSLLPYGYSILDYARRYDEAFIALVRYLEDMLAKSKPTRRLPRKRPFFPPETTYEVLSYLDSGTLRSAAQVSKMWEQLACRSALWDTLLLKDFSLSVHTLRRRDKKEDAPKTIYRKMHRAFLAVASSHVNLQGGYRWVGL